MVYAFDVILGSALIALPYYAGKHFAPQVQASILSPMFTSMNVSQASWNHNISVPVTSSLMSSQTLPPLSVLVGTSSFSIISSASGNSVDVIFNSTFIAEVIVGLAFAFLSIAIWKIFAAINAPVNIRRIPTEPRKSRMQKATDFPPPFPNGWYCVEHSHRLAKGQVKEVQAFGLVLAVFRGFDGKASVVDGICPHLGANLGHTGVVSGNCLKCIFHGWEFDSEGNCVKVHGTDTIPHNAKVKKYPTQERNGMILVYYDCEDRDPTWELEPHPNVEAGEWYISGETYNIVHAHINEIPENGADAAHLDVLHQPFIVSQLQKAMDHRWTCTWEVNKEKPHASTIALTQGMNIFSFPLPFSDVDARIRQIGPGIVVLELDTIFGPLVTYETIIPTKTTSQIARHVTFAAPTVPRIIGKFIMWGFEEQFNRDVPIWETKKYIPKPLISKADGPILNYRRWMSQFYTPASVSFADALAKEYMLDW